MKRNLKIGFCVLWMGLCLAGCSKRGDDNMITQEIKLDDTHNVGVTKDPNTPAYKITQCGGLLVNRDDFRIPKELNPKDDQPNAIHVAKSNSKYSYRAEWKESGQLLLNRQTLVPVNNSPSFKGFKEGEGYVFAIGRDNFGEKGAEKLVLKTMWMGTIEIASR